MVKYFIEKQFPREFDLCNAINGFKREKLRECGASYFMGALKLLFYFGGTLMIIWQ